MWKFLPYEINGENFHFSHFCNKENYLIATLISLSRITNEVRDRAWVALRTKDQRFYLVYYQRFTAIDFILQENISSLACISVLRS